MLGGLLLPPYLTRYSGGGGSQSSSDSTSYDYSGLAEHLKAQDEVDQLRDAKYQALYGGDVAGSVAAGNRIRSLLGVINSNAPGATEQNPHSVVDPLVKVSATSSHTASDTHSPALEGTHSLGGQDEDPAPPALPVWKTNLIEANERKNEERKRLAPARGGFGM